MPDSLWQRVEPLLPARPPRRSRYPGRLPVDDRVALVGIVFVLKIGISWRELPAEVFGCSGVTCWRRLRAMDQLDLDIAVVDGSHVRALKGGKRRAPRPSIRLASARSTM